MKEFWNERFSEEGYSYGTEPNVFLKEALDSYKPSGPALFPADGEGRNGVYAATLGYDVTSFDYAASGKSKALALAETKGVNLNYQVASFEDIEFPDNHFGLIALIFAHFTPAIRAEAHQKCIKWLKPGGYIILEAFSQHHLRYNRKNPKVGGPKDINLLYTKEDIYNDFKSIQLMEIKKKVYTLNEGDHHSGEGAVIRFVGKKY